KGGELGGGSGRSWRRDLLEGSFALQGQSDEAMREKFGAILEAFEYGAPPHGGIAMGIDRWAALLSNQTNIREVMAFPKTQSGGDLMLEAPSAPEPEQLAELGLRFVGVKAGVADPNGSRRRSGDPRGPRRRPPTPSVRGRPSPDGRAHRPGFPGAHRATTPARRTRRGNVHRVLGHLLPVRPRLARDGDRLSVSVRP